MQVHFSNRIKSLRETKGLLQRQVASHLEIDTPMLSKIERGERKAKKEQVFQLATVLEADKDELLTLWLADQIFDVIKNEKLGKKALKIAEEQINTNSKK